MQPELFCEVDAGQEAHTVSPVSATAWAARCDSLEPFAVNLLKSQQFSAKPGEIGLLYAADGRLLGALAGTGDDGNIPLALACAATRLPPGVWRLTEQADTRAYASWVLAQYRFDTFRSNTAEPRILCVPARWYPEVLAEAAAVFLVRDLINRPANLCTPADLSRVVADMAATFHATFREWVGDALVEANFPAIHAVGRAAAVPPRLLSLTWGEPHHPRVTLVGKGICFDSGGLDIKPSTAMRLMKKDMGGAAQVIGLAQWMMASRLAVRLHVLVPAAENAVGPLAYRPGDILRMRNGLSVEVDNTDAEGRLVLADAIALACEENPALVIDFATLTGAARVAVGTEIAACFCNDESVALGLAKAAEVTGDPVWRMPLYAPYKSLLDSQVADMVNSGTSPYAGAITAALFLERFVTARTPWVHFDINAWNVSSKPGKPEGGEAMGMRAVAHYLLNRFGTGDIE